MTRRLPYILLILLAFTLRSTAQETNPVKLVKGIITDAKTGRPVDGGMIFAFEGTRQEASIEGRINPKSGAFQMILSPATQYRIRIESPSYRTTDIPYTSPSGKEYQELEKNFSVQPLVIGSPIFTGQLFAAGSAQLQESSDFRKAVEFLRSQPYTTVTVTVAPDPAKGKVKKARGTTTAVPTAGNAGASLVSQRIDAIKAFMSGHDIDTGRMKFSVAEKVTAGKKKSAGKSNVAILLSGIDPSLRR
jgi:hypothetical protein